MVAFNFKAQFANDVESGRKRQTIRATRKDGREAKAGDALQLYTGMRTKACHKLRDAVCCDMVREILIEENGTVKIDGQVLYEGSVADLARADGFDDTESFISFFRDEHGLPFRGHIYNW